MASVDNLGDKEKANQLGYRTYRILPSSDAPLLKDEVMCPHYTRFIQCQACGICDGKKGYTDNRKNVAAPPHGPPSILKGLKKRLAALDV
jgi:hypothetical protein